MRVDDEHRLIARYAACLAADDAASSINESKQLDVSRKQRELVAQLEAKNREIVQEIHRLRQEQEKQAKLLPNGSGKTHGNPTLLAELRLLRQRRDELEARMSALQESRRELMVQLESLMTLLKQSSPQSTPGGIGGGSTTPRARTSQSPPKQLLQRNNSMPAGATSSMAAGGDSLRGLGGDVREAFAADGSSSCVRSGVGSGSSSSVHSLRDDLLVAADSVTNAMSSLVKQLNVDDVNGDDMVSFEEFNNAWPVHVRHQQQFLQELRSRAPAAGGHHTSSDTDNDVYMMTDYESCARTDGDDTESYVKTDDDESSDYQNVSHLCRL